MKILMATQEYYPKGSGIANVAYYIVEELKKLGHEVKVLSPYGPDIKIGYEKAIEKYAGFGLLPFWIRTSGYIGNNYDNYDLFVLHNPLMLKKINPKKIFSIVHTTYVKYYDLYKNQDISFRDRIYYLLMKHIERFCYKKNKLNSSCVSPAVCDELLKLGLKKSQVTYIPNGVNTKAFRPMKEKYNFNVPKDHKVMLYVGRFNQQKQLDLMIETFAYIENQGMPYSLVLAGDGELMPKCRSLIAKKGLKNIHLLGKIEHKLLPKLYSTADFFIMSSCYEGQPLTMLEGMSCGLPCILSDIPNIAHFVKDSGTGVVIDFTKPKHASEKMISYLNRVDLKKESAKIRKFAENNLDWSVITKKYLKIWEK